MKYFNIFLSCQDGIEIYPNNSPKDFIIQLPRELPLHDGEWMCYTSQVCIDVKTINNQQPIDILADVCQDSYVDGNYRNILTRIILKKQTGWQIVESHIPIRIKTVERPTKFIRFKIHSPGEVDFQTIKVLLTFERTT